jgi:hypothetical protein
MSVSSLTVKDSTATTKTLSKVEDPNNSSSLVSRVVADSTLEDVGQPKFFASAIGLTPAATATDLLVIVGSATKTVRVKRISVSGGSTSGGSVDLVALRRSVANTGGTAATVTPAKGDSQSAAATAVVSAYSANPSALGASAGVIASRKFALPAAGNEVSIVIEFPGSGIVLRGVAESLAINLNGSTIPSGSSISVGVAWKEDTY